MRKFTVYNNDGSLLAVHKGNEFAIERLQSGAVKITYNNGDEFVYINATCVLSKTKERGDE